MHLVMAAQLLAVLTHSPPVTEDSFMETFPWHTTVARSPECRPHMALNSALGLGSTHVLHAQTFSPPGTERRDFHSLLALTAVR
jgi:hypothetical protein